MRKILHVDMDAFYASIEQRDYPYLRDKPVAVGGNSKRGVVAAASYEARKYGVFSAMPGKLAVSKCPHIIFVPLRLDVYRQESKKIREIFLEYTDLVEPLSLDEAYLDVTENKKQYSSAMLIGRQIKQKIKSETGLTASVGISVNKFLAKIASDYKKPDGFMVIMPDEVQNFIHDLPVKKFHGVGLVTASKMEELGIKTGKDLQQFDREFLVKHFGKNGNFFFDISHGIDERPVNPNRIRKSVSVENTFEEDLVKIEEVHDELKLQLQQLYNRLGRINRTGKTITLKIRYSDFSTFTRSKSISEPLGLEHIQKIAFELLEQQNLIDFKIRLIGLGVSNLITDFEPIQLKLPFKD
jgi:DNA polymerase-4